MMNLEGKVALVTGANRGIGQAIATRFAKEKALVIIHYGHDENAAQKVNETILEQGGKSLLVKADLSSTGGIDALFTTMDELLRNATGSNQLDIIVNNAGIWQRIQVAEITEEMFDRVIAIDLKAPFFLLQRAGSRLREGGRIINISSGVVRSPVPDMIPYAMAKGALNIMTLQLAKELGSRNITVNSLSPGITDTDMNSGWLRRNAEAQKQVASLSVFGRIGRPEDIADVAAFLASPDSRWITGQVIDASGGALGGAG